MAKRTATTELTHENWDEEEIPEDPGTFQKASENVLKSRVIKRAVRRNPISSVRTVEVKVYISFSRTSQTLIYRMKVKSQTYLAIFPLKRHLQITILTF